MKANSQTAYIVFHIWLVGSICAPLFTPWWGRAVMGLFAAIWLLRAGQLARKERRWPIKR